jgi:hypothetical protein
MVHVKLQKVCTIYLMCPLNTKFIPSSEALRHTLASLTSLTPTLSETISIILTRHCSEAVSPAKSIPAQVRMSKRSSNEPSAFVAGIMKPVKNFFGIQSSNGGGERLKDELLASCASDAFDGACRRYVPFHSVQDPASLMSTERYALYLASWKKAEESLRRINKVQKSTFSLFGGGKPSKDDKTKDDERIRTQMIIDVNAFSQDAQSLGVNVEACEAFIALRDLVHSSLIDGEHGIELLSLERSSNAHCRSLSMRSVPLPEDVYRARCLLFVVRCVFVPRYCSLMSFARPYNFRGARASSDRGHE